MTWDEDGGVRSEAIRALGAIGGPTPVSAKRVLTWLQDPDPMVRTAAVESLGQSSQPSEAILDVLMRLLDDPNDQVKVEVTKVLPNLAGGTPAVIAGLCRRLIEDDSDWVQVYAALALGKLGTAATAAGRALASSLFAAGSWAYANRPCVRLPRSNRPRQRKRSRPASRMPASIFEPWPRRAG